MVIAVKDVFTKSNNNNNTYFCSLSILEAITNGNLLSMTFCYEVTFYELKKAFGTWVNFWRKYIKAIAENLSKEKLLKHFNKDKKKVENKSKNNA